MSHVYTFVLSLAPFFTKILVFTRFAYFCKNETEKWFWSGRNRWSYYIIYLVQNRLKRELVFHRKEQYPTCVPAKNACSSRKSGFLYIFRLEIVLCTSHKPQSPNHFCTLSVWIRELFPFSREDFLNPDFNRKFAMRKLSGVYSLEKFPMNY